MPTVTSSSILVKLKVAALSILLRTLAPPAAPRQLAVLLLLLRPLPTATEMVVALEEIQEEDRLTR